ncbi:carbohydrate-binding module family 13 protein [Rhizophagus irregularis DAOM 181602=DAOM 197198]|nr:carbohydrate-binding module family 13 protein [Rhizophagus irregularis DAOM 181602=DAOM 197198]
MEEDNKLLPKLSQNLLEILNDEEYYDITIEVGNDPYVKVFRAHMVILHYRSSYLRRILSTNKKKNDGTLAHIKLSNISPEIFQIILRYIYGGKLSLNDYDNSDIIKVLVAANELSLQELVLYLQFFLIENKENWMENNFNFVYQTSFENDSFSELQKYCINLISKEPIKIFNSLNFSSIPEKLLISIIQNDNLQISEIQIWENVLKWGLAQNPELPSDITNFLKDDFNTLKNTLQQYIPFINFYNLTSKEFVDKVFPYKEILPEELCTDLLKAFLTLLNPDSKPIDKSRSQITKEIGLKTVDSKIITSQHAELISKWIDRLEITDKLASSYEFKLLFRASRDGHSRDKFHEICDNKSRTVTIIKVKDNTEILGGYNPIEWGSDGKYGTTKDSFIFSFTNDRIENYILSRVVDEKCAMYNWSAYGPSFGENDLIMWNIFNINYCKKFSYEKSIRKTEKHKRLNSLLTIVFDAYISSILNKGSFKDTKRLKDENRRTDEKETGEKRLIPETPSPTRFLKNIEKYKKRLKQQ